MSEQQSEPTTTTTTATETPSEDAWGQPISPERQAELQGYLAGGKPRLTTESAKGRLIAN